MILTLQCQISILILTNYKLLLSLLIIRITIFHFLKSKLLKKPVILLALAIKTEHCFRIIHLKALTAFPFFIYFFIAFLLFSTTICARELKVTAVASRTFPSPSFYSTTKANLSFIYVHTCTTYPFIYCLVLKILLITLLTLLVFHLNLSS